ncbi:MAG: PilZ domain-containing protein [Elusimicrobiota bacterium]|jgi:hypothetical protein
MASPFRRLYARYNCDVPVFILSFVTETKIAEGRFVNLSVGGALIDCAQPLEKHTAYLFELSWKDSRLALSGRIAWNAPRDPRNPKLLRYGVQFNLTSQQEDALRILVDKLRQETDRPQAGGFLRRYWNR